MSSAPQQRVAVKEGETERATPTHDTEGQTQGVDDAVRQNLAREEFAAQP